MYIIASSLLNTWILYALHNPKHPTNNASDDIVLELLQNRIKENDCKDGFILDGFPRNVSQANSYIDMTKELGIPVGNVIYIDVPKEITKKRIVGRLSCKCGAVYNDQIEENRDAIQKKEKEFFEV